MDVVEQRPWTDEDLAVLYGRFFGPLFDVAVRVLGSEDDAGHAVSRAFSRAFTELRRRPVDDLRPWLYGLLAAELSHNRPSPSAALHVFAQIDPDRLANPSAVAHDEQVVGAVWTEASALPVHDYLLLDLQLRHGLRDPELGRALGLDLRVVDQRLERLRGWLEEAVQSPVSPVAVFAALAPIAPPPGLKERVWASLAQGPVPPRGASGGRLRPSAQARDPGGADRSPRGGRNGRRILRRARKGRPRPGFGAQHVAPRRAGVGESGRRDRLEPEPRRERLFGVLGRSPRHRTRPSTSPDPPWARPAT